IEAAAVATECESSPSSSRSTEISDSGYRTASASSTNDVGINNFSRHISMDFAYSADLCARGQDFFSRKIFRFIASELFVVISFARWPRYCVSKLSVLNFTGPLQGRRGLHRKMSGRVLD